MNSLVNSKLMNQTGLLYITKYFKKQTKFFKKKIVLKTSTIQILFCNLYNTQEDNNLVFL